MNLTLQIWRQKDARSAGKLTTYMAKGVDPEMGFLDMLDVVNDNLEAIGQEPVAFDGDCRQGSCGSCGCMVNGKANGPRPQTTLCQQKMAEFSDGDTLIIEPFRARAFPVIKLQRSRMVTSCSPAPSVTTWPSRIPGEARPARENSRRQSLR